MTKIQITLFSAERNLMAESKGLSFPPAVHRDIQPLNYELCACVLRSFAVRNFLLFLEWSLAGFWLTGFVKIPVTPSLKSL